MNITEFLKARIAEDEETAWTAQADGDRPWMAWNAYDESGDCYVVALTQNRALAECAAKRAIVAEHELVPQTYENRRTPRNDVGCNICAEWDGLIVPDGPCRTLRHLAAVYDQHPDYDPAWRP